ncbi:MAG: FHA domain-containing protein [Acidimicrobiia bacterium]
MKLPPPHSRAAGRCLSCGAPVDPGRLRCHGCGAPLRADLEVTMEVATTEPLSELVGTRRADELRQWLSLRPGESALLLVRGPGAGSSLRLGPTVVSLGRHRCATMLLDDVSVSRRHAEIRPRRGGHRIVDLGSLNGTYLNGRRVEEADLAHGDAIQIGLFKLLVVVKPAPS